MSGMVIDKKEYRESELKRSQKKEKVRISDDLGMPGNSQ